MSNISRIEGYDEFGYKVWEFALPTMDEATANAQRLGEAMRRVGISADRAAENIARISELLARMECVEGMMDYKISSRVGSIETKAALLENKMSRSENRIYEIERDLHDLRSAMDAKTENPNQKGDLEIFSQIEWDESFLKILEEPIKFDF